MSDAALVARLLHVQADKVRDAYQDYKAHATGAPALLASLSVNLEGLIRLVADQYAAGDPR